MTATPQIDEIRNPSFLSDVLAGLAEHPRTLPGKYLWDEAGSDLFDRSATNRSLLSHAREMALLPAVAAEVAAVIGSGATVVEFGSGASRKIRTLLDALDAPAAYIAVDISGDYLAEAIRRLAPDYRGWRYRRSAPLHRPLRSAPPGFLRAAPGVLSRHKHRNFSPRDAGAFLTRAREALGPCLFLVGPIPPSRRRAVGGLRSGERADGGFPPQPPRPDEPRTGGGFRLRAFRHEARICADPFRVEAHLVARAPTTARVAGTTFRFAAGDSIRTDTSHKYTPTPFGPSPPGAAGNRSGTGPAKPGASASTCSEAERPRPFHANPENTHGTAGSGLARGHAHGPGRSGGRGCGQPRRHGRSRVSAPRHRQRGAVRRCRRRRPQLGADRRRTARHCAGGSRRLRPRASERVRGPPPSCSPTDISTMWGCWRISRTPGTCPSTRMPSSGPTSTAPPPIRPPIRASAAG